MPRFLADSNVGRLARWLRVLGYDTVYEPVLPDAQVVARARAEARVLLTRDVDMMKRRVIVSGTVQAILLRDDTIHDQLRQVLTQLALEPGQTLTRCIDCNAELQARAKEAVADRLPPYVRATQERFSECPSCARVYWPGTHWERMRERIAAL
jgi:uncharacterized protein